MKRNMIKKYILDVLKECDYHLDSDEICKVKYEFDVLYDRLRKKLKNEIVVLYAMYYFQYYCDKAEYIEVDDIITDFAVTLMVASKFVDDHNIENSDLSYYIDIPLSHINKREVHIVKTCKYNFYKSIDDINEFYHSLEKKYNIF